jgi:hypothetical protein
MPGMEKEAETAERCLHVRGKNLVPGWCCCSCRVYNSYERAKCRWCSHPACYPTDGEVNVDEAGFMASGVAKAKLLRLCESVPGLPWRTERR